MTKEQLKSTRFVGVVEDNMDPKRLGRCRIRITELFGDIPLGDIPWAKPRKDVGGNCFSIPEKGKVVTVIFEQGSVYKPEYIQADHHNVNLETKLEKLSEDDYKTFRAVMFDHSTQIYRTKSKGLILDHEYSNINIDKKGDINFNLRNNDAKLELGTFDGAQQAVLGNHFVNWLKRFMDTMNGTPYIGNKGAPVALQPTTKKYQEEFLAIEKDKILSQHVKIVDNGYVKRQRRDYEDVEGDPWKSTVKNNSAFKKDPSSGKPNESGRNKDEEQSPNNSPTNQSNNTPTNQNNQSTQNNQPNNTANNQDDQQPNEKFEIIFMGGLDDRKDKNTGRLIDLTLEQQVNYLRKPLGTKKIKSHRYNDINGILISIRKNPDARVILFSAACVYANTIAENMSQKNNLFLVEPYGLSKPGQPNKSIDEVRKAINAGVPPPNVTLGPTEERGKGIFPGTMTTPDDTDHYGSLTWTARFI